MIDLFGDKFPTTFNKTNTKSAYDIVYKDEIYPDQKQDVIGRLYVLLNESVVKGSYDSKFLVVTNDLSSNSTFAADTCVLLRQYGVNYVINLNIITVLSKNITIHFSSLDEISTGNLDHFDADCIIPIISFQKHSSNELDDIKVKLKRCMNFSGQMVGFIRDYNMLTQLAPSILNRSIGEIRLNGSSLEVWNGASWIGIYP